LSEQELAFFKSYIDRDIAVKKISLLFDETTPRIKDNLASPITEESLERIVKEQLTKVINNAAKEPNSGLTFEALTGNLKVDSSLNTPAGKVTTGQINIYKLAAYIAGIAYLCQIQGADLDECAKTISDKIATFVREKMVFLFSERESVNTESLGGLHLKSRRKEVGPESTSGGMTVHINE
jgi:hypothetical protein